MPAIIDPSNFSTNSGSLPANDDGSSSAVDIGFSVQFTPTASFSQLFVNNNGNLTFDAGLSTFTPSSLVSLGKQIIAPFWADVDTRANPNGGTSALTMWGQGTVMLPDAQGNLVSHAAFAVTWNGVDYFNTQARDSQNNPTHNSLFDKFQVILIDRSDTGAGNFDIEFNYDSITWETGDASGGHNGLGGTSARVGYANVDGTTFELPGSGTPGSFLDGGPQALASNSNVVDPATGQPIPGRYVFAARGGQVIVVTPGTASIDNGTENGTPVGVTANFSATYTVHDPNNPGPWPGGASIDWGDAAPGAPPDVTAVAAGDIHFVDQGTSSSDWQITGDSAKHVYTEGGRYPIRVHVNAGGSGGTDIGVTADVADATLAITNKADLSSGFTENGAPFDGPLFAFSDPQETGALGPGNYTVMINWNDGTPVETIDPGAGPTPSFIVHAAPHIFRKAGNLSVQITVIDNRDMHMTKNQVTDTIAANVQDPGLLTVTAQSLTVNDGQSFTDVKVGTLTDPDPNAELSDYFQPTILLDFGGQPVASGISQLKLMPTGSGQFDILASGTFSVAPSSFSSDALGHFTLTIGDKESPSGVFASASGSVSVHVVHENLDEERAISIVTQQEGLLKLLNGLLHSKHHLRRSSLVFIVEAAASLRTQFLTIDESKVDSAFLDEFNKLDQLFMNLEKLLPAPHHKGKHH